MTRVKLAELTSGVGALVLGIGLGALFATWIGPAAGFVTLAGLAVHAFGMWDKHRIEKRTEADADRLVLTLYWVCWLMLGGVLLYLVV
jgi:uncharacterized membrane protein YebE (DUF533 family)